MMKGKVIDEEKALIYDNDDKDYDENNALEENSDAILSNKIVVSARKWQQEQESDPILLWPTIFEEGHRSGPQRSG